MKTPKFWKNDNLISKLLSPLGVLYASVTKHKIATGKFPKLNKKVICVGNLSAGGTGKTPVSISICKILQDNELKPCFVTRGYGGKAKDLFIEKNQVIDPIISGDEPLLLSKIANVSINANRYEAGKKAIENGADIIIMDDGFQNPSLYKDQSIIVIDGEYGFGNKRAIPAGPLRENISDGLKRAQAIIVIGEDKHNLDRLAKKYNLDYFNGHIEPIKPEIKNKNVLAFAGIGRPEKLYNSLSDLGYNVTKTFNFEDHHYYTDNEIENIINIAKENSLEIFTTTKDLTKIPEKYLPSINVLDIKIKWKNEDSLKKFLLK